MQFCITLMLALVVSFIYVVDGQDHCVSTSGARNATGINVTHIPDDVQIDITTHVDIACVVNSTELKDFDEITRVRIVKHSVADQSWDWVMEIRNGEDTPNVNEDFKDLIDDKAGEITVTTNDMTVWANFTWKNVTEKIFGEYRCDVIGFDPCLNFLQAQSPIDEIKLHNVTSDEVFDVLLTDQVRLQNLENEVKALKDRVTKLEGQNYTMIMNCSRQ